MPTVDSWSRASGQNVFVYLYVQMEGVGNYAHRYRYTQGPAGLTENPVIDVVNGIEANLGRADVEALF